eukprot:jgi/Ulvmu1/3101/UM015_0141.1
MAPKKKTQKPELPETDGENSHVVALRLHGSFQLREAIPDRATEQDDPAVAGTLECMPVVTIEYTPLGHGERISLTADEVQENSQCQLSHVWHAVVTEELVRRCAPSFLLPLHVSLVQPAQQIDAAPSVVSTAELLVDLSGLLLGETECTCQWSSSMSDIPIPTDMAPHMPMACVTIHCCEYIQPESLDDPLEAKSPHAFLPPLLLEKLAPITLTFPRALDLPDLPATPPQLDTDCYRCCLRLRLPSQSEWHSIPAVTLGAWSALQSPPDRNDACDPPLRKRCLAFLQPVVIFACDLDLPRFLDACLSEPLVVEVHDRDAKPVEIIIPMPKDRSPAPPPEPEPVEEPVPLKKSDKKGKSGGKQAAPAPEPEPAEEAEVPAEPEFAPLEAEYVCGRVQLHLAPLARGLTALQLEQTVQPYTTVQAHGGLDWRQRPGEYMHAQSRLEAFVRCSRPLPELVEASPRPFSRALFVMDHADSVMFHVVEDCVRLHNSQVLALLPRPDSQEPAGMDVGDSSSDVDGSDLDHMPGSGVPDQEQDVVLPPVLQRHLDRCDDLTKEVLQSLSIHELDEGSSTDASLDVFTGFHLVDGKQRIIVVEGLAEQAMQTLIVQVAEWALRNNSPLSNGQHRRVLYNGALRYSERLYHSLGANLWILKTRRPLKRLLQTPSTFTRSQVRSECKEGLRRLGCLDRLQWARQLDGMALWPTAQHLNLIDRKFGGALTRADTLGVDGAEDAEDEDGAECGYELPPLVLLDADELSTRQLGGTRTMSRARSSRHSSRARPVAKKQRYRPLTRPALDMRNAEFEMRQLENAARRSQRNLKELLKEAQHVIATRQAAAAELRRAWQAWNPQRAAQRRLCEQLASGDVTAGELDRLRRERLSPHEPQPGAISADQARTLGWYPHGLKFAWPAPSDPLELRRHPKRPDELRIEQLKEAWDDGALSQALQVRSAVVDGEVDFDTSCAMQPPSLFNKDPSYEKSVFIPDGGEDGMAEQERQLREAELKEWTSRVVVADTTFHTGGPRLPKPGQVDRSRSMLRGEAQKLALKKTYVPAAPISMFLEDSGSTEQGPPGGGLSASRAEEWKAREDGFRHVLAKEKCAVHKPTLNQSWYGALRDVLE